MSRPRTLDFHDHDELRVGCRGKSSIRSDGVSCFSDLVLSFGSDLRSSGLPGDVIPINSSFLREPYFGSFGEHGDDLLGSVFLDDTTKWGGSIFYDRSIGEC